MWSWCHMLCCVCHAAYTEVAPRGYNACASRRPSPCSFSEVDLICAGQPQLRLHLPASIRLPSEGVDVVVELGPPELRILPCVCWTQAFGGSLNPMPDIRTIRKRQISQRLGAHWGHGILRRAGQSGWHGHDSLTHIPSAMCLSGQLHSSRRSTWAACVAGSVGGLCYLIMAQAVIKFGIDDPVEALAVHGAGGKIFNNLFDFFFYN